MKMSKGWKQFERTLLVLLVLLLFVLTGPLRLRSGDGEQSRVTTLRTGWYQLSDGGRKEIQLPVRMETFGEGSVELWNDSLRPEDAGKVLSVGGVQYGPEVWLGETLLYRYEDNAFPKNDQMKGKLWADITLPQETGTEPLRLIYTQTGAGELIIEAPELGSRQEITGSSIGGGQIVIRSINGFETEYSAQSSALIIRQYDRPGVVSEVSGVLAGHGINIAVMRVSRSARGETAFCIIETDDWIPREVEATLRELPNIISVRAINLIDREESTCTAI